MTRFNHIALIAASLLMFSCAEDQMESGEAADGLITVKATAEDQQTKNEVDEEGAVYWTSGDEISVLTSDSNSEFKTAISTASKVAEFTGTADAASSYLGLYPYSEDAVSDGRSITTALSSEQQGVDGTFDRNLFIAVAKTNSVSTMNFMNVCSGVRFKVKDAGITSVELKSNAGEALAGKFNVGFSDSGLPVLNSTREASAKVRLSSPDASGFIPDVWYYIVTLPATLSKGFTLTYFKDGNPYSVASSSEVKLLRSRFGSLDGADGKATLEMTGDASLYWEEEGFKNTVTVIYSESGATVQCSNSKITYGISGAHVWVNLGDEENGKKAEIILSGSSSNGSLKVYGEKKFKLTLDGVDLTSEIGPAINSQDGKRMFLHILSGTSNFLCDAATYSDDIYYVDGSSSSTEQRKGCLFSEGRIIVSGNGSLQVTGKHSNAIATDDFFYMRPGPAINIPSAASNGLKVGSIASPAEDDYDVEGDLIGCTITGGTLNIAVDSDGGKAINCESNFKMSGGNVCLLTAGNAVLEDGSQSELDGCSCIKVDNDFKITDGTLSCISSGIAGKGINVDGNIQIGTSAGERPVIGVTTTGEKYGTVYDGPGHPKETGISSYSKAIKADGKIVMYNGDITVATSGTGAEGLESKSATDSSIVLLGGQLKMRCKDDCINSPGRIIFGGAEVFAMSYGNDAIDSNMAEDGAITISGGIVLALTSGKSPNEGFDSDSAAIIVTGGYAFSIGGTQGSLPTTTNEDTAKQCSVMLKGINLTADTYASLVNSSDQTIFSVRIPFSYSGSRSFITCPELSSEGEYTIQESSSAPAGSIDSWTYSNIDPSYKVGVYKGGDVVNAATIASFTMISKSTTISYEDESFFGPGMP